MSRFFQSPEVIDVDSSTPLIFLEGPVQGAQDWQTPFAHRLLLEVPGIAVASPRPLDDHVAQLTSASEKIAHAASDKQVAYEFLARKTAFHFGAIAMWWAAQDPSLPYNPERVYAKTTSKEEAEAWGILDAKPDYPFIVGYDPAFTASSKNSRAYSERNHALLGITTHTSLEDVYQATKQVAQKLARQASEDRPPVHPLVAQSIQRALDQLRSE